MHNNMQAYTGLFAVENFDFPNYIYVGVIRKKKVLVKQKSKPLKPSKYIKQQRSSKQIDRKIRHSHKS